ncbi:hypothetical protein EON63_04175 [archaeon]|nr:MAG: hypothetical protein EON63_04175 [archaeon]
MVHLWEKVRPEYQAMAIHLEQDCDWDWIATCDEEITSQQLEDYQLFLLCKKLAHDIQLKHGASRLILSPPEDVENVWREHILRPQLYLGMCKVLTHDMERDGKTDMIMLHYYPEMSQDPPHMIKQRVATYLHYRDHMLLQPTEQKVDLKQAQLHVISEEELCIAEILASIPNKRKASTVCSPGMYCISKVVAVTVPHSVCGEVHSTYTVQYQLSNRSTLLLYYERKGNKHIYISYNICCSRLVSS